MTPVRGQGGCNSRDILGELPTNSSVNSSANVSWEFLENLTSRDVIS